LREEVHVIGHYAVGVKCDCVGEGLTPQIVYEPLGAGWIEKDLFSAFGAEGYEKPGGAYVAVEGEADVFVAEHAWVVAGIVMQLGGSAEHDLWGRVGNYCSQPWLRQVRPSEDGRYVTASPAPGSFENYS